MPQLKTIKQQAPRIFFKTKQVNKHKKEINKKYKKLKTKKASKSEIFIIGHIWDLKI